MAITQKVRMAEFWFMFTRLFHNVFYQCMKFQVNSFYGLEVMTWTKIQTENYQRAITKKNKGGRVMVLVHCTSP